MRDHLGNFFLGDPVVQRALQVSAQLFRPVRGDQCRADDKAAVTLGKLGAFPDIAEQDVVRKFRLRRVVVLPGVRIGGTPCERRKRT